MARTIAKSVSVLIVKSSTMNAPSVPIRETGTASSGMIVARQFCRNTKMTKTTSSRASKNVMRTSSMDVLM